MAAQEVFNQQPAQPAPGPIVEGLPKQPVYERNLEEIQPTPVPETQVGGEETNEVVSATPPPPKKDFRKILIIIGAIALVVIIGVLVFKFFQSRRSGTLESQEITLTWWGLWETESIITPLISEYQQQKPNVRINYVQQSQQEYRERLTNALAKGTGPDIFRLHNSWVPMFRNQLDVLPATVMRADEFNQTFHPVITSDLTLGSNLVGVPLGFDCLALFVNQEIFETYAKSAPTTWDDLRQTAIELTIKDEQGVIRQAGVALGRTENVDHWPEILGLMMLQNGVRLSNPTGELAENALTFFTLFSQVDKVWDQTLPSSTQAFASGKLAMYLGPSWRAFEIKAQNPTLRFKVYPVPQLPKQSSDEPNITYASYWVEGVWNKSQSKQAAWEFLKFLSTKASLEKLYQAASQIRSFGEPYPRTDMKSLLMNDSVVGAFLSQASGAKSWYLASRTFDGSTGINSQINKYFENAVNSVNQGTKAAKALETAAAGVTQVLTQYGLITPTSQ
jgi:multiple sugar transport system substrate-binding protein